MKKTWLKITASGKAGRDPKVKAWLKKAALLMQPEVERQILNWRAWGFMATPTHKPAPLVVNKATFEVAKKAGITKAWGKDIVVSQSLPAPKGRPH